MLIWVASYPRSGSNLTMVALESLGFRHETVFDLAGDAGEGRWDDGSFIERIEAVRESGDPVMVKTHAPLDAAGPDPALLIVRDGRDALVSYQYFVRQRRLGRSRLHRFEWDELYEHLIDREDHEFANWSDSIRAWLDRDAPVALIRFEELRADPQRVVGGALGTLGVEVPAEPDPMPTFEQMRAADSLIARRGRAGDWRRELSDQVLERFALRHGELLVELGYETDADARRWETWWQRLGRRSRLLVAHGRRRLARELQARRSGRKRMGGASAPP